MLLRHLFYNECSCLNNIYHHSEKCKRVCFIDNSCKITYNNRDGGRFMKNKKIILIIIGVVVGIALIGSILFYNHGISAVSTKDEEVIVKIESGSSASQMLDTLDKAGLVNNKLCGKLFLKFNHFDKLQANTYIFHKNMSLSEIFDIIQNPDFKYILKSKLTIKEGNTIPEVAKAFSEILDMSDDDIIKAWSNQEYLKSLIKDYWFIDNSILNRNILYPLEGYLYPDTYYPHQFLTFASIVERESGQGETDRPMIAGVFMNRLKKGMLLQSDITVNYAWQRTGVDVSYSHLEINSQYNTYKYTGLPVGPISSVPATTMEACLQYKKHDYFYFFAIKDAQDKSKTVVVYTKTYEEHTQQVKKAKDAGLWLD